MLVSVGLMIGVVLLIAVPALLLVFKRFNDRWTVIAIVLFVANAMYLASYMAPWQGWSLWLFRALAALCVVAIAAGLFRLVKADWQRPRRSALIAIPLVLLAGGYFAFLNFQSVGARELPDTPITLQWPLKGDRYYIVQGGASRPLQSDHAATGARRYAVDAVRLGPRLHAYSNYLDYNYTGALIWDEPVHAPCTGRIEWARDGMPDGLDYDRSEKKPAGNVVSINCDGVSVMIPHFRQGSVAVEVGEAVSAGDLLGRIGNSGGATGPHLHIHAERGPLKKDVSDNTPVPIVFEGQFLSRGDVFEPSR